jgi:hypothetical protein
VLDEINERGQIVGAYGDEVGSGTPHDFLLDCGHFTSIEFPDAPDSLVGATTPRSITRMPRRSATTRTASTTAAGSLASSRTIWTPQYRHP